MEGASRLRISDWTQWVVGLYRYVLEPILTFVGDCIIFFFRGIGSLIARSVRAVKTRREEMARKKAREKEEKLRGDVITLLGIARREVSAAQKKSGDPEVRAVLEEFREAMEEYWALLEERTGDLNVIRYRLEEIIDMARQVEIPENHWYKVLGVMPDASDEQVTRLYRQLARIYHEDMNQADTGIDVGKFKEISEAYRTIKSMRG
jgi:DnaJ-domain-containing protein 1